MAEATDTATTPTPSSVPENAAKLAAIQKQLRELSYSMFKAKHGAEALEWLADSSRDDGEEQERINHCWWIASKLAPDLEKLDEDASAIAREIGRIIDPPEEREERKGPRRASEAFDNISDMLTGLLEQKNESYRTMAATLRQSPDEAEKVATILDGMIVDVDAFAKQTKAQPEAAEAAQ